MSGWLDVGASFTVANLAARMMDTSSREQCKSYGTRAS